MTCRLVKIEWIDSCFPEAGWKFLSDIENLKPSKVTSVGFLIKDHDKYKILAASQCVEDESVSGVIVIPVESIKNLLDII